MKVVQKFSCATSGETLPEVSVNDWAHFAKVFTVLHGMQTRSSDENSVCPSVRPSVTRVDYDKTVERSIQIYIPYGRSFSLVF